MSDIKGVDFFCGGGGMTHGMKEAGIDILAGIDFDLDCKETYERNNKDSVFLHKDLSSYHPKKLREEIEIKKNDDNLVFIGCSPCQYWSIIRSDKTKSRKSKNLLKVFRSFVEYYNPGYIVIENVPGINKKEKESGLASFVRWMIKSGYEVHQHIVNMNDYGVPQSRKRFSLIQ